MIYDLLDDYIEEGRVRKAIKGCIDIAMEEGYIQEDNYSKLYDIVDKYIPADK